MRFDTRELATEDGVLDNSVEYDQLGSTRRVAVATHKIRELGHEARVASRCGGRQRSKTTPFRSPAGITLRLDTSWIWLARVA